MVLAGAVLLRLWLSFASSRFNLVLKRRLWQQVMIQTFPAVHRQTLIVQTYGTLLDCENQCEQDSVSLEKSAPRA
jgi:hypothetical protein